MRVHPSIPALLGTACLVCAQAQAKKTPPRTWQVSRTTDPVTGSTTCVVAAFDRAGKSAYSRTGFLYPMVENNPVYGILVGVSSGGKYRVPTGDIVWRIDGKPYRDLRAADNPAPPGSSPAQGSAAPDVATRTMQEAMALSMKLATTATATATLASGERARAMLDEMLAGHQLIYRAAAAAPAYGLPSYAMGRVGQITGEGLKPFPIDASFREGLNACGIPTDSPAGG